MEYGCIVNQRQRAVEWRLCLALLALMVLGALFIYSAGRNTSVGNPDPWYAQLYVKQIFSYLIGIVAGTAICLIEYHRLARWSLPFYWLAILLLVAVMIVGVVRYGARRWLDLGFFSLQPSELAKLAFILIQANYLSQPPEELRNPQAFWSALGLTVLPFILILKEPDLGSALVLLPVGLTMMFVAGIPGKYLARLLGWGGLIVALLLADVVFAPPAWRIKVAEYQRQRLLVYFGRPFAEPNATPEQRRRARDLQRERSYNIEQALISVGSGGLVGKGWLQGTQNALGYLPRAVAPNDFIFSVIAEEQGFLGSVIVIALYGFVLFFGLRIAAQARDRLGKLLAVGVVTLLFGHVFINIGMNISLMPVTGIPLPLLSYGGTSVLCSLIAIGILQNVYLHRRDY